MILHSYRDSFNQFYPVTSSELAVSHMRVSSSPLDVIPTHFLLVVMVSVGTCLLSVMYSTFHSPVVFLISTSTNCVHNFNHTSYLACFPFCFLKFLNTNHFLKYLYEINILQKSIICALPNTVFGFGSIPNRLPFKYISKHK